MDSELLLRDHGLTHARRYRPTPEMRQNKLPSRCRRPRSPHGLLALMMLTRQRCSAQSRLETMRARASRPCKPPQTASATMLPFANHPWTHPICLRHAPTNSVCNYQSTRRLCTRAVAAPTHSSIHEEHRVIPTQTHSNIVNLSQPNTLRRPFKSILPEHPGRPCFFTATLPSFARFDSLGRNPSCASLQPSHKSPYNHMCQPCRYLSLGSYLYIRNVPAWRITLGSDQDLR